MPDFTRGQFPSLDGDPEAEVAQRTEPDTDGNWFRKVFTVHNRSYTKGIDGRHPFHLDNFVSVLQAALQQGLHPKGAPELEAEADHPTDGKSTNLTYRVPVVPAVADVHPETTVTPSNLDLVLANPNALQPIPVQQPAADATRWDRGEGGTDADGAPLLPPSAPQAEQEPVAGPTPPADPSTPPAATSSENPAAPSTTSPPLSPDPETAAPDASPSTSAEPVDPAPAVQPPAE